MNAATPDRTDPAPADPDVVVVPPAPGDAAEMAADARRSRTLAGGISLAEIRAAALGAMAPEEHLPFPLVRRLGSRAGAR